MSNPPPSPPEPAAPFADNWAYLRTELNWLERLLMASVARQRLEQKEQTGLAQTPADQASRHWWQGVITLRPPVGYDMAQPPPTKPRRSQSYPQQLSARVQASRQQGIPLALPWLQRTLHLSQFEKNVVLLALAPEVNHRFSRLYRYLQSQDGTGDPSGMAAPGLPTVDLCLRLLCRNDQEWRRARPSLTSDAPLLHHGILTWIPAETAPWLGQPFRLAEDVTAYLLAETPNPAALARLTRTKAGATEADPKTWVQFQTPTDPWKTLIAPEAVHQRLDSLCQRHRAGISPAPAVVLTGASGTGKTKAAQVVACALGLPLVVMDWGQLSLMQRQTLLEALPTYPPCVVLVRGASVGLGRQPALAPHHVRHWLQRQGRRPGITFFATTHSHLIRPTWQSVLDGQIALPRPDAAARRLLWRQVVPRGTPVERKLRWVQVAHQLPLTGGEIATLATTARALPGADTQLTVAHLQQALALHHPHLRFRPQR